MQSLGWMESDPNSDTLLAEIIATRMNTINVKSLKPIFGRGSKGGYIKAVKTLLKSQLGK